MAQDDDSISEVPAGGSASPKVSAMTLGRRPYNLVSFDC